VGACRSANAALQSAGSRAMTFAPLERMNDNDAAPISNRRVLPAVILAGSVGFLGLHRIYAGRYLTGLIQLAMFGFGALSLGRELSGIQNLRTADQVIDWALTHQLQPLPVLLITASTLWALWDCVQLLRRQFRDGAGRPMRRWM